jgi:hypothetical protein
LGDGLVIEYWENGKYEQDSAELGERVAIEFPYQVMTAGCPELFILTI